MDDDKFRSDDVMEMVSFSPETINAGSCSHAWVSALPYELCFPALAMEVEKLEYRNDCENWVKGTNRFWQLAALKVNWMIHLQYNFAMGTYTKSTWLTEESNIDV